MWIALGLLLVAIWVIAKVVAGVASMAIHLALLAGIAFVIVHFAKRVRGHLRRDDRPGTATGAI